ncbi:hypothetical protein CRD60_07000 [Bifidobacterium aemilianum]|uniref:Uncharacterized protein n=1 Tax=Bifidobacterium aemilianum TaxID=2493120 RepID=A0A366K7T0_9BIFI|nr:hypothetical protein [Bifidobacterium aemilianum]RBP97367.1 hypothetical protein CRD60_07000 [Bifidobacterium aemilianum]
MSKTKWSLNGQEVDHVAVDSDADISSLTQLQIQSNASAKLTLTEPSASALQPGYSYVFDAFDLEYLTMALPAGLDSASYGKGTVIYQCGDQQFPADFTATQAGAKAQVPAACSGVTGYVLTFDNVKAQSTVSSLASFKLRKTLRGKSEPVVTAQQRQSYYTDGGDIVASFTTGETPAGPMPYFRDIRVDALVPVPQLDQEWTSDIRHDNKAVSGSQEPTTLTQHFYNAGPVDLTSLDLRAPSDGSEALLYNAITAKPKLTWPQGAQKAKVI